MKIFILVSVSCVLLGCGTTPPNYTLAELSDMTTRTYLGKTKADIYSAAESIFKSVDSKNMEISMFGDELKASRSRLFLPVTTFDWRVKAEQIGDEVKVFASVITKIDQMEFSSGNGLGVYGLFFDRLDYYLGVRKDLVTCELAEKALSTKTRMGNLGALCFLSYENKPAPNK